MKIEKTMAGRGFLKKGDVLQNKGSYLRLSFGDQSLYFHSKVGVSFVENDEFEWNYTDQWIAYKIKHDEEKT